MGLGSPDWWLGYFMGGILWATAAFLFGHYIGRRRCLKI
jgi:hypothetical protein